TIRATELKIGMAVREILKLCILQRHVNWSNGSRDILVLVRRLGYVFRRTQACVLLEHGRDDSVAGGESETAIKTKQTQVSHMIWLFVDQSMNSNSDQIKHRWRCDR